MNVELTKQVTFQVYEKCWTGEPRESALVVMSEYTVEGDMRTERASK